MLPAHVASKGPLDKMLLAAAGWGGGTAGAQCATAKVLQRALQPLWRHAGGGAGGACGARDACAGEAFSEGCSHSSNCERCVIGDVMRFKSVTEDGQHD